MCHLILLMPIIGLGVFWIWPFDVALPIYLVILTVSGVMYAAIMKAMHRRVSTGDEGMIGEVVEVMDRTNKGLRVHLNGAIWWAVSDQPLHHGDRARVVSVDGLTLKVEREASSPAAKPPK